MPPRLPLRSLAPLTSRHFASPAPRFVSSTSGPSKAGPSTSTTSATTTTTTTTTTSSADLPTQISSKVDGAEKKNGKPKRDPIPPLPRPPGVFNPPTAKSKTWAQRKEELLDDERHKAKRKALVKEATQGYFHDYNRAKVAGGGKLWIAPNVLIREDKALYFPDIQGRSLLGQDTHTTNLLKGKTTIVSLITTRLSEEHEQSFVQPVLEDVAGHPNFNFVQINHQENKLKSMLVSFLSSSLKRTIPEERWGSYLIAGGEWSKWDITVPLGLDNKLLGYIYLVDPNLKVRWAGCGQATREEAQALRRATAVLLGRMKAGPSTS
ncbi:hypothetical protein I317_07523 [Kwoniella heveanensis CBS 569]|nr:hypothetical protein I317_07523 [Kwoniella heveanensis CBS 569]